MNFKDVIYDVFITEAERLKNHNSLLLLDIDDTLLKATNIFIYRKSDGKKLTPEQFREEIKKPDAKDSDFDFRDFRDEITVSNSIKKGKPILSNLQLMDRYINNGWKIGLLTARGMEDVIAKAMQMWLMYRTSKGELKSAKNLLKRDLIFAISDKKYDKKFPNMDVNEKKKAIIADLSKKYDRVMFIDDDTRNLNTVKTAKENKAKLHSTELKNVYTKLAKE